VKVQQSSNISGQPYKTKNQIHAEIKSTLNSGNAYYLLAHNFLTFALLTKNLGSRETEL